MRDPRGINRVFHIGAMLTLLAMGVMAGHKYLKPVVRHCGKLTQRQRVALGPPRFDRKGGGDYRKTPRYTAFYSLLRQLPPDDFAAVRGRQDRRARRDGGRVPEGGRGRPVRAYALRLLTARNPFK